MKLEWIAGFLLSGMVVAGAKPVLLLDFEGKPVGYRTVGDVSIAKGPAPPEFPDFAEGNRALVFGGAGRLVVKDAGEGSALDFDNGDSITLETWVWPVRVGDGDNVYLIGKGRTANKGFSDSNQNYALRLRGQDGQGCASFLFRSRPQDGHPGDWHRWTADVGVVPGEGWAHVAVTYEFGRPESIRGYLNGQPVKGKWDMGGPTGHRPVVDDDELWIASALGGSGRSTFSGRLDEVAIHREALSPKILAARFKQVPQPKPVYTLEEWPSDKVRVELVEAGGSGGWPREDTAPETVYQTQVLGFFRVPHQYGAGGLRVDRSGRFLLRAVTTLGLRAGQQQWLVRSRWPARLWVDGQRLVDVPMPGKRGGAHGKVPVLPEDWPDYLRIPGPGDLEKRFTFQSQGKPVRVRMELLVGHPGGKLRHDLGETTVAISQEGGRFEMVGPHRRIPLTDAGWMQWRRAEESALLAVDTRLRREASMDADARWAERHALAREFVSRTPAPDIPAIPDFLPARNEVDQFIGEGLVQGARRLRGVGENAGAQHFRQKVLPLLEAKCLKCHHGSKAKSGLTLDTLAGMLKGGESGQPALVPQDAAKSLLFTLAASRDPDERMPPKGDPVDAGGLKILREWIEQGAPWPDDSRSVQPANDNAPVTRAQLKDAGLLPAPLTGDLAFLRRVTLDTLGVFPSLEEIRAFEADSSADKRAKVVDRLLGDPRWADNWVGYWQDVLAENPNVLKPKLNNTGPFREWIHESFLDNKPMDRFATELITMKGSSLGGGPAGFALATQNDVPMAAKAHVLGTAFLGTNLQCARCHDAPYHPFKQADLFGMAAMLARKPLKVPASSSVVLPDAGAREPLVEVTLKPGSSVSPGWRFPGLLDPDTPGAFAAGAGDSRARLAAFVTSPLNERFAKVIVNRLWKRYFGTGLVESAQDWHNLQPSHPELLDYLAREFIINNYDLKHLARLLLNSHAYQRQSAPNASAASPSDIPLFAAQTRRRLRAEQLVDGLYHAAGLPMEVGELNMDRDGGRGASTFLNLGYPRKAWHYASLSNERDRPSLAFPRLQAIIDTLKQFGWRPSRQEPLTDREGVPHALQPGILANGVFATWLTRLSSEHAITEASIEARSPEALLDTLFLRFLTRRPTEAEQTQFLALLADGFPSRVIPEAQRKPIPWPKKIPAVSWSNHLSPEANSIMLELEQRAREGDPPSNALDTDWRERMEDALWAVINTPELLFLP